MKSSGDNNSNNNSKCFFFVFSHGIVGQKKQFDKWIELIKKECKSNTTDSFHFHSAGKYENIKSFVGIENCGKLFAQEVLDYYEKNLKNETREIKLSIVVHSFGGLTSRYALGFLKQNHEEVFKRFKLCSYITLASPHLGALKPWGTFRSGFYKVVAENAIIVGVGGKSCKEMTYHSVKREKDDTTKFLKKEIVYQISKEDSPYIDALKQFEHITLVGSSHYDISVGYTTAMIWNENVHKIKENTGKIFFSEVLNFEEDHVIHSLYDKEKEGTITKRDIEKEGITGDNSLTSPLFEKDLNNSYQYPSTTYQVLNSLNWRRICVTLQNKAPPLLLAMHLYYIYYRSPGIPKAFMAKRLKESEVLISKLVKVLLYDNGLLSDKKE